MASMTKIVGVDEVLKNLRKAQLLVADGFERGLKRAGHFLQRESQLITPVDTGNLKNSAFTRAKYKGTATEVWVGYTAAYAVFVHENLNAAHGSAYNAKYASRIGNKRDKATGRFLPKGDKRNKGRLKMRGPDQQAKFLEKPAREKRQEILDLIYKEAQL